MSQSTIFQLCQDGSSWVEPVSKIFLFQNIVCILEFFQEQKYVEI